jgi:parallel beta-helix repeat protein
MSSDHDEQTDDGESTDARSSRRGFLGASALGLAGLAAGAGRAGAAGSGDENAQFAVDEHDHSGAHGAASALGTEAPVESIRVGDLASAEKPVVDVRAHGATADGETDDHAALQAALDAADDGDLVFLPAGTYACSGQLTVSADRKSLSLVGAGMGATELRFTGSAGGIDVEYTGEWNGIEPPNLNVRDLSLTTGSELETALSARWTNYDKSTQSATCTVQRVEVNGPWQTGIHLLHAWNSSIADVRARGRGASSGSVIDLEGYTVDTSITDLVTYYWDTGISIGDVAEGVHMTNVTLVAVGTGFDVGAGLYFNLTDSHVNAFGGPALDVDGADDFFVSGCLLWNLFGGPEAPAVRLRDSDGFKLANSQVFGGVGGLDLAASNDVSVVGNTLQGNDGPGIAVDSLNKVQIAHNNVESGTAAVTGPDLFNAVVTQNIDETGGGVSLTDDLNVVVSDNLTYQLAKYLVRQGANNGVPNGGDDGLDGETEVTYGQSFTVEQGFPKIQLLLANYGDPDSRATLTLYEGSPESGSLTEVDSVRTSWADNSYTDFDLSAADGGTYYLEMSDPEGTPTWWWHQGESNLSDVGGTAFVNREPVADTNFCFWVYR